MTARRASTPAGTPAAADNPHRIKPSELEDMDLGTHDGVPITRTAAKITKTGDGLSESLHMAPIRLPMGAEVMVLVPARVVSHEYDFVKDGRDVVEDERLETAVLEAQGALFVDPDLVDELVAAHMTRIGDHRRRIKEERDAAKGIHHLPLGDAAAGDGEAGASEPDGDDD